MPHIPDPQGHERVQPVSMWVPATASQMLRDAFALGGVLELDKASLEAVHEHRKQAQLVGEAHQQVVPARVQRYAVRLFRELSHKLAAPAGSQVSVPELMQLILL